MVGGTPWCFLVMEYVEGRTLRALLEDLGTVPEALVREIGRQVAEGLAAIHEAGVVHRDLKPENVLITDDHRVRIMDLGVARIQDASAGADAGGAVRGVAAVRGAGAAEAGDGGPGGGPLRAGGGAARARDRERTRSGRRTRRGWCGRTWRSGRRALTEVDPDLSPFLAEVVSTLLEKDPAKRFPSAADLARVLEEAETSAWWGEREGERLAGAGGAPAGAGAAGDARSTGGRRTWRCSGTCGRRRRRGRARRCWWRARRGSGRPGWWTRSWRASRPRTPTCSTGPTPRPGGWARSRTRSSGSSGPRTSPRPSGRTSGRRPALVAAVRRAPAARGPAGGLAAPPGGRAPRGDRPPDAGPRGREAAPVGGGGPPLRGPPSAGSSSSRSPGRSRATGSCSSSRPGPAASRPTRRRSSGGSRRSGGRRSGGWAPGRWCSSCGTRSGASGWPRSWARRSP